MEESFSIKWEDKAERIEGVEEKAAEGNLRRVRGESGDVFLERAYVEAT